MQLTANFILQEFVPPETYKKWGNRSIWFVNMKLVLFNQWLKDYFGGNLDVIVNDYWWNKDPKTNYLYSGYRPPMFKLYAKESMHRSFNATDTKVEGMSGEEIRDIVRNNYVFLNEKFGVTTIEKNTPTWCHVDLRLTLMDKLFEVKYK